MAPIPTGLQDAETAQLLDTVDKLRSLGSLSQDISLPQIIVVGQQSSGKSSVLEAISGIPFPVNDGLCTQFATEVILRRSRETKRSASINAIDAFDSRASQRNEFADKWKNFEMSNLGEIISEAKECMALEEYGISQDKLRLEISGPDQDHLTLVDLPGLIVNARLSQSDNTVESIRKLVVGYVRQPLSTILAVVSGQADLENQGILGLLKDLDGGNKIKKTLGVITQPDTIHAGTVREKTFLALAENSEFPLALGWHVLRNLSSKEKQDGKNRAVVEREFFETESPWCNLLSHKVGVTTLKKRLSKVLLNEIASQLGNILARIEKVISETALTLDKLGEERSTSEQQRAFLIKIGDQYRHLVSCALEGEYHDTFFDQYTHRLRARIVNENIKFANSMVEQGHRWNIKLSDEPVGFGTGGLFSSANVNNSPFMARKQLIEHVQDMQRSYRGNELHGMFPVSLVGRLFKEQACNWKSIATDHLTTIFEFVKEFMKDLLHHVAETEVSWTLLENLIDPEMDRKSTLLSNKLDELLHPYLVAQPVTLNMNYVKALTEARKRWHPNTNTFGGSSQVIDVLACEQVVDTMEAYYNIAISVFVDNIATLAIESCLLSDLSHLISPVNVAKESIERLALLGSESSEIASTRQRLRRKLQDYEEGRTTIRPHVQRHARLVGRIGSSPISGTVEVSSNTNQNTPAKQNTNGGVSLTMLNSNGRTSGNGLTGTPSKPVTLGNQQQSSVAPSIFAQQPLPSVQSKPFSFADIKPANGFGSSNITSTAPSILPTHSAFGSSASNTASSTPASSQATSTQPQGSLFGSSNSTTGTTSGFGRPTGGFGSSTSAATSPLPDSKFKSPFGSAFTEAGKVQQNPPASSGTASNPFGSLFADFSKTQQTSPTPKSESEQTNYKRRVRVRLPPDTASLLTASQKSDNNSDTPETVSDRSEVSEPTGSMSEAAPYHDKLPNGTTDVIRFLKLEGHISTKDLSYEEAHWHDWKKMHEKGSGNGITSN